MMEKKNSTQHPAVLLESSFIGHLLAITVICSFSLWFFQVILLSGLWSFLLKSLTTIHRFMCRSEFEFEYVMRKKYGENTCETIKKPK